MSTRGRTTSNLKMQNGGISKRLIALNLVLLLVAGALGWQLYRSIRRFDAEEGTASLQSKTGMKEQLSSQSLLPPQPQQKYNPAEFAVIDAQNIFAESRNNQKEKEEVTVQEVVPELKVRPILLGIITTGDQSLATIAEPGPPNAAPGALKTQIKHVGDVYQGYTVTEISTDRMILQNGPRREVIAMFQGSRAGSPKVKTPLRAARVINFGPAAAAPAMIASTAQNLLPPPQTPASPGLTVIGVNAASGPQGRQGIGSITPAVAGVGSQSAMNTRGIDTTTNARVVNTPWGQFVTYPP